MKKTTKNNKTLAFAIGAPAPKLSGKAKRQLSSMLPSPLAAQLAADVSKAKVKRPAFAF